MFLGLVFIALGAPPRANVYTPIFRFWGLVFIALGAPPGLSALGPSSFPGPLHCTPRPVMFPGPLGL